MKCTLMPVAATCAALLLFTSCDKNSYDAGNNTILSDNSAELLKEFQSSATTMSVTAGVAKEVVGPQGTYLRFYPHSFKDKDGNVINSGTINIELTEMYSSGDMMKYHTSTTTGSDVLKSGGHVYIRATMNGEEVSANKYGIGFNADSTPTMGARELYYGNTYAADQIVTWADASGATGTSVSGAKSVSTSSVILPASRYFMFDSCTSFHWVSAHHPYEGTSQHVTVNVKLANDAFAGNVWSMVYTGISKENITTALHQESFDRATQTAVYKGLVPTGTDAKFMMVIPRDKFTWFYYQTEQTLTDGITIDATLIKASKTEMEAAMQAF